MIYVNRTGVKRVLSVLLAVLLFAFVFASNIPAAYAEEPIAEPIAEPTTEPTEEPTEEAPAETETLAADEGLVITTAPDGYKCVAGEVIVAFEDHTTDAAADSTLSELDAPAAEEVTEDIQLVDVPAGETLTSFIDALEAQPEVDYAQPNYVYELDETVAAMPASEAAAETVPEAVINDPEAYRQWYLNNISAYSAWDTTMGDANVRVAVLDTGVDLDHPDLTGQIVAQADTVANDGNADDDHGHGTHVAGIIAAKANNGTGGSGVAPGAKIIAVDVFIQNSGSWYALTTDIVEGLQFAAANGADVINMSLGSYGVDTAEINAINAAVSGGIVIVAAGGNDATSSAHYPSDIESVIGVIATGYYDGIANYSNYGAAKDIAAPGGDTASGDYIFSTYIGGGYGYMAGTSMACPVVAGVAALILSADPLLSVDEVKNVLYSTATDLGTAGKDDYYGYGRVNASAAVQMAVSSTSNTIRYQSHIESIGWQSWKNGGEASGTSGQSLRLEAIRIQLNGVDGGVEYRTHVQNIGWMGWVSNGALSGTEGLAYRLEAIQIQLTGSAAAAYDIYYRVHAQNIGWMGWAKNGQSSGTAGYGYRLEAIEIRMVPKGGAAPGSTSQAFAQPFGVSYQSHVQNIGWQDWKSNGATSGTSGLSYRLEAMRIKLDGIDGGIEYRTHVQNIGWMNWVGNSATSGTSGLSYRLEAINIRLTGNAAALYDVYYRVHAQNFGWMGWAKNGEASGTAGYSYRLEAIQIMLVVKGAAAPGSTANAFIQR